MNIIINELKKIFKPINITIVALITVIIWFLFISFNIEYFPNGSDKYIYDVSVDILNKYGTSMDEDEFKDLKKYREKIAEEATEYLLTKDLFVKSGCTNYDDLIKVRDNYYGGEVSKKELNDLYSKIIFEENNYLFWQLENLDYVIGLVLVD